MKNKMRILIDELNRASEAYYGGKTELMSDYEWNEKFDELLLLEKQLNFVFDDSPTKNVSHEILTGKREKHEYPALSLPKSKLISDVVKWANNLPVDLSWKLDGMTVVVTWDDGVLTKVVTRGDGEFGNNITHLVDAISNIPKKIDYMGHLVVRGEAVVSYADLDIVNLECGTDYDSPRNLVSGSLNPLTTVENIMNRHIVWIPFTLVHMDDDVESWKEQMSFLKSIGFKVVESEYISNIDNLPNVIEKWSNHVDKLEYPVDGLVVVYDDTVYASKGNMTGHHNTRGGYAFKWEDVVKETTLKYIEWSCSVHSINPVAVFDGIQLENTLVQRASLCNISECERLGIGDVGTSLEVIKANKIIPKVVAAKMVGEFFIPKTCPVCGASTEIKVSDTSGTKVLVCTNDNCVAKNLRKMSRFVSRHGFDITGLSHKKLLDLINKGLIHNFIDILTLPSRADDVKSILFSEDGWGEKSVSNLLNSIEKSLHNVTSENVLYAMCIPMCGRDISKKLTRKYTLSDIVDKAIFDANNDSSTVIDDVDGIGEVKGQSFIQWFAVQHNIDTIRMVMSLCDVKDLIETKSVDSSNKLQGLNFVITGKLNHYSSRDVLKELIEDNGGKVLGSVSATTSYLINNDVNSTSSKNKKAKSLGVEIISEDSFMEKFQL